MAKGFSLKNDIKKINWYPPYLGAGISVTAVNDNFTRLEVQLKSTLYNKNLFGTHFGGSLYSMCDPFFVFIITQYLGKGYIVWDKAASIQFKKPGTGTVKAVFEIEEETLKKVKSEIDELGKKDYPFSATIKNSADEVVAEVEKLIYVRKK